MAWNANCDLALGRFALFMDERITFDGVYAILHPPAIDRFIWAVSDGGDHRYGRSLWNFLALVSVIPTYIWGESAQIISSRMGQSLIWLTTSLLVSFSLFRTWPIRILCVIFALSIPYVDYYATMPKPEPLQIFFLILFFLSHIRRGLGFHPGWFFLGLALGTKISILPIVLFMAVFSSYTEITRQNWMRLEQNFLHTILFFSLGVILAVPILWKPFLGAAITSYFIYFLLKKTSFSLATRICLETCGWICALISRPSSLYRWISNTLLNTKHGSDSVAIGPVQWFHHIFTVWLSSHLFWAGFIISLSLFLWLVTYKYRKLLSFAPAYLIFLSGFFLVLSIVANVHRIWGFYLFPGIFLMGVGTLMMCERFILKTPQHHVSATVKNSASVLLTLIFGFVLFSWSPATYANFTKLALRSKDPEFILNEKTYFQIMQILDQHVHLVNRPLFVAYDPVLFIPSSTPRLQIVEFWGPYTTWEDNFDFIVLGKDHTPFATPPNPGVEIYQLYLLERQGYAQHVIRDRNSCEKIPCYERIASLHNGGEVLRRVF